MYLSAPFIHILLRIFWWALIFPFMVTQGIIKVRPKHYFFSASVLQLRGGPVIAEICIRNSGAAVSASICFPALSQGQSDQHLSTGRRRAGRGLRDPAAIPLDDRSVWTTGEKLQENGRSWAHGVTGRGYVSASRGNFVWTWGYSGAICCCWKKSWTHKGDARLPSFTIYSYRLFFDLN